MLLLNSGLMLTGFWTTRPWSSLSPYVFKCGWTALKNPAMLKVVRIQNSSLNQPPSQGPSSSCSLNGGRKMRDPGNKVGLGSVPDFKTNIFHSTSDWLLIELIHSWIICCHTSLNNSLLTGGKLSNQASKMLNNRLVKTENCSLLGTDNVRGQISWHISAPNGGYCLHIPQFSKLRTLQKSFEGQ